MNNAVWVLLAIIITAVVTSSRMLVSDHTKQELIAGLSIGVLTQLMAYFWVI
jgi:mannose/fructose-specific phosphotransferase system component IIA